MSCPLDTQGLPPQHHSARARWYVDRNQTASGIRRYGQRTLIGLGSPPRKVELRQDRRATASVYAKCQAITISRALDASRNKAVAACAEIIALFGEIEPAVGGRLNRDVKHGVCRRTGKGLLCPGGA